MGASSCSSATSPTRTEVRALTAALRGAVGRPDAPILIDQEGGRVARLGAPHWKTYPPGRAYGELVANDPLVAREITRLGARLIAHDLLDLAGALSPRCVLREPVPLFFRQMQKLLLKRFIAIPDLVLKIGMLG